MKLIELIRALGSNTYVRIGAFDSDMKKHTIIGETTTRGYIDLLREMKRLDCSDYTVTQVYALWHAQELYIECMKW